MARGMVRDTIKPELRLWSGSDVVSIWIRKWHGDQRTRKCWIVHMLLNGLERGVDVL